MVQFVNLPQPVNIGGQLGSAIGQGLQKGLERGSEVQFQKGLLQEALNKAKSNMNPAMAKQLDPIFSLMESGIGVPGSEKYLSTLLPLFLGASRANQAFPQGGEQAFNQQNIPEKEQQQTIANLQSQVAQAQPGQMQGNQGQPLIPNLPQEQQQGLIPQIPQGQMQQGAALSQGASVGGGAALGNIPQIIPENQIAARAEQLANIVGDPSSIGTWQQYLTNRNAELRKQQEDVLTPIRLETARQGEVLKQNQQLENVAKEKLFPGGITNAADAEELNDFMRIGQKNSGMNPNDWFEATRKDFSKFSNIKGQFDKAFVPGSLRGIYLGGDERESELNRLTPLATELVKYGKEDYARNRLAELGVTQTEAEKIINPLQRDIVGKINNLPKSIHPPKKSIKELILSGEPISYKTSPKIEKVYESKVADFLKDNLGNNSLLAIRDSMMNKKNYSWEQFYNGFLEAQREGLQLNPRQQAELEEIRNPPKDSIANIFRGAGNFLEYLRGSR